MTPETPQEETFESDWEIDFKILGRELRGVIDDRIATLEAQILSRLDLIETKLRRLELFE